MNYSFFDFLIFVDFSFFFCIYGFKICFFFFSNFLLNFVDFCFLFFHLFFSVFPLCCFTFGSFHFSCFVFCLRIFTTLSSLLQSLMGQGANAATVGVSFELTNMLVEHNIQTQPTRNKQNKKASPASHPKSYKHLWSRQCIVVELNLHCYAVFPT